MKSIIFLGAGASKAEGAPLQNELLFEYFKEYANKKDKYYNILRDFFLKTYNLDVCQTKIFPTIEEILGLLYTSEKNQQSFYFDINKIKEAIIFSMGEILDKKIKHPATFHFKLIEKLKAQNVLQDIIFVTTNYDTLIDRAIYANHINIDYGVYHVDDFHGSNTVSLFKIYGSLNWLYCDVCDAFVISSYKKSVLNEVAQNYLVCKKCNNQYKIVLIPPTFYKEIWNYHLNNIYHDLNKQLYDVEQLIFCGYSFPDADIYIKFILKRAEIYRNKPFKVLVINDHEDKSTIKRKRERDKYNLFFNNTVEYKEISFQEYVNHPILEF
ncbi:MAG: SIR2 family protein [Eubacteriales bacterium]